MQKRDELTLIGWQLAVMAGETLHNGALGRGIEDSTLGREFAARRLLRDDKADYALGYALGRFACYSGATYGDTLGQGKARLYQAFLSSHEGRGYMLLHGAPILESA